MTTIKRKNNSDALYKPTILFVATALALVSSLSPLTVAPMIFAQVTSGGGSSNISSNATMENMVLNLGTPLFIDHTIITKFVPVTIPSTNISNVSNATFVGNGTFMLPSTGKNVSTVDLGTSYRVTNTMGGLERAAGQVLLKTADGKERAVIDFARYTPVNSTTGVGIAHIRTNSTAGQQLASLNNTLMVYRDEAISPLQHTTTFWKWNPAISSSTSQALSASSSISGSSSSSLNNTGTMMVLNLGTPLFIDHSRSTNITSIGQNIVRTTFIGNGTFMLPTIGRNVSTVDLVESLKITTGGLSRAGGQALLRTIDGKESALLDFSEIQPINSTMAIGIAYIHMTSATTAGQQLGPLNNTLGVYKDEAISPTQSTVTLWKWK